MVYCVSRYRDGHGGDDDDDDDGGDFTFDR